MSEIPSLYGGAAAPAPNAHAAANAAASAAPDRKPVTLARLAKMHADGEKIAMLTCYDACFAKLLDAQGVDMLLVGDSLGMVLQGQPSTLPVTVDDMVYHTQAVARGARRAMVVSDLPFASYQRDAGQALDSAAALMRAGAQMVKLEGGAWLADTVHFLVERGIPVCAHIGFTPQSVHQLGGYRVQGRGQSNADRMRADALALAQAGAALVLMEMVPTVLATEITQALPVPTIGIGAGAGCSGQVLVLHDMLGAVTDVRPKFVKNFLAGRDSLQAAVAAYVSEVKAGSFPAEEHGFA